jgi:hypothetical protein
MKKLIILAAFAMLVMPASALAQDGDTLQWDVYLSAEDPGETALGDAPWVGPFAYGAPIADPVATVGPGGYLYIGIPNGFRWVHLKTLWIRIYGGAELTLEGAISYNVGGPYGSVRVEETVVVGADLYIRITIFPQPDWEVIILTNGTAGPVVVGSIEAESWCRQVSTTTTYGLAILALLLIGSTVWILRRKRIGAAA